MIDFKVLVKVIPTDPMASLRKLGEKVTGDEHSFVSLDPRWVAQQDYITAVPVEVALTVEMREVVQTHDPETRFIITGVTNANVDNLINMFGYKVFPPCEVKEESVEYDEKEEVQDVPAPGTSAGQDMDPVTHTQKYYYNGKEISEEEYGKRLEEFTKQFVNLWGEVGSSFFKKLFS